MSSLVQHRIDRQLAHWQRLHEQLQQRREASEKSDEAFLLALQRCQHTTPLSELPTQRLPTTDALPKWRWPEGAFTIYTEDRQSAPFRSVLLRAIARHFAQTTVLPVLLSLPRDAWNIWLPIVRTDPTWEPGVPLLDGNGKIHTHVPYGVDYANILASNQIACVSHL